MKKLLVIKLGGSVITYKDSKTPKARISVIRNLAKGIKQLSKNHQIILVHGAGYVHYIVKEYNLHLGLKEEKQKMGLSLALDSMRQLNQTVIKELLRLNLKAIGLSPNNFVTQYHGRFKPFSTKIISSYLRMGYIPVLSPDMVQDDILGCSVLSGDTIVAYLAKKLHAHKVIFLSDVDGIFDSDPKKNPQAKLIKSVNNKNLSQVLKGLSPNNQHDVSGEMLGKLQEIKKGLSGMPVLLLNGLKPELLLKALDQNHIGTEILFR